MGDFSHMQVVIHMQYLRCRSKYSNTIQLLVRLGERFVILEFAEMVYPLSVCVGLKDEVVATGEVNKLVRLG